MARGIAIGTASHALGTSKAIEMGEIEGAMSGLSIAVAGLMTVAAAQVFALLWCAHFQKKTGARWLRVFVMPFLKMPAASFPDTNDSAPAFG